MSDETRAEADRLAELEAEVERLRSLTKAQAARSAEHLARAEAAETALEGIKRRDAEVGDDEGWWVGGAWGDYGEAVVPLRILSYVVGGKLDEKVASIAPGFALTYAEQTARAEAAEARLDVVGDARDHC
ncbi:MAG: hypothetical protein ACTH31_13240 [Pseudoclavibacter sp.]